MAHIDASGRSWTIGLAVTYLWINLSEVFRYFAFVMPMTRAALPQIPDVAPMSVTVFLIWGVWDTILFVVVSAIVWLFFEKFGGGMKSIIAAGSLVWLAIFCIFWLATYNMNLTIPRIPLTALPFAWLEMVVAAAIIDLTRRKKPRS